MPAKSRANNQKYLEYSELSKEELVQLLRRVHARIKRVSLSIREIESEVEGLRQLLLYGAGGNTTTKGGGSHKRTRKAVEEVGEEVEEEPEAEGGGGS
jgi:hypothetical protein